jgi:hypothetical protein
MTHITLRQLQRLSAAQCSGPATRKCSGCAKFHPLAAFRDPIRDRERKTCTGCRGADKAYRFTPTVDDEAVRALYAVFRAWPKRDRIPMVASLGLECRWLA